ncbi:hypothetical protein [Candidatus Mycoplasma haematobovis]|uniref:hypothetical protein n=1 Tax=Candidatus Mycoplasma haematobovis TaxID=432608 RepID=UPI001650A1F3|nr:hypothetical protein [Candidatus Mycoplasma haematobovis]
MRIGLGLGSVCAVSSVAYWSTQYNSHLPQFNVKPALTSAQRERINSPSYRKILKAEGEVGCKFYLILDFKNANKTAYNLLREQEITDDMIEKLATSIDNDKSQKTDTNLSIENMKAKCASRYDKKLRIVRVEIPSSGSSILKQYQYQVRTNEQGGSGYNYKE